MAGSDAEKPGVILGYDAAGHFIALERPEASRRMTRPTSLDSRVGPPLGLGLASVEPPICLS